MRKVKKLSIWVSICFVIIVILAAVSLFLAKKIVSREDMKEGILSYLSEGIGGEVTFESIDIKFFHRPHVLIRRGKFSVPGKVEGSFETLLIYPKVLPLFVGKVEVSALRTYKPDFKVFIKEEPRQAGDTAERDFSLGTLKGVVAQTLAYLDSRARGLQAEIIDGSVLFKRDGTEVISLTNFNASLSLPDDKLSFSISSNSNFWDRMNLKGWMNVKDYKGSGSLVLSGFEPHKIIRFSLPGKELVSDSSVDLALRYNTQGLSALDMRLDASIPYLILVKNDEELKISGKNIDLEFHFDDVKRVAVLNNADLIYPRLELSGKYEMDRGAHGVNLWLRGDDVNVESARDGALFVGGGNHVVDTIFDVVRGGRVPVITLDADGDSFRDLWREGNFTIKGSMINGAIHIPVAGFDIVEAKGDAVIADGVLRGTGLSGRLGNSLGYDGTLLVGVSGREGPLNLEVAVDADPAQIPPVLEQFVHDDVLLRELRLIENVNGTAKGKLVLGGMKKSPDTVVYVSGFDITADYERFPYPVNVRGGEFDYDDKKIEVEGLNVAIGKSSVSSLSGSFGWKDERYLRASFGDAEADFSEIFSWLSSVAPLRRYLGEIKSAKGSASISSAKFEGPLSKPTDWRMSAEGNISGVNLELNGSAEPITIASADIRSTQDLMSVSNANVTIENSEINLEVVLSDYLTDLLELEMDFEGTLGPAAAKLLSGYVKLPEELVFEGPLSISDSRFVLRRSGSKVPDAYGKEPGSGSVESGSEFDVDINIKADAVEWNDRDTGTEKREEGASEDRDGWNYPLNGKVSIKSETFKFKDLNWGSLDAMVTFLGHGVDIDINEASLCGISTPGFVKVFPPSLRFEFRPFSSNENLADVLKCLLDKAGIMSGEFDFQGDVYSDGRMGDGFSTLEGALEVNSVDGRVNKFGGIAKFFTYLNFGELFRGQSPDFGKEGFPYDKLVAKADIKEGKVMIKEAAMDGPSLKIVCEGYIDIVLRKLDLQVLVIPVLAVDSVIDKIPLVSYVLGSDYVSIPIKVTGDISNPKIEQLSPSALRFGLLGIIKQTLNIPVTLIKPLNKKQNGKESSEDGAEKTETE